MAPNAERRPGPNSGVAVQQPEGVVAVRKGPRLPGGGGPDHGWKRLPLLCGRKALAGFNDLATLAPEVAAQWYWTLNGSLTPEQVTAGSRRKVWWECPYGHVWKAAIYSRTGEQHSGCPVCAGKARSRRAPAPAAWAANQSNSGIGRI